MFTQFVDRLKDFVSADVPNLAGTPPAGVFVKGINFGGEAVTIEGYSWDAYDTALANGLLVPAASSLSTSVKPIPAVPRDLRKMLNTVVYKRQQLDIIQPLPNGNYQVYLWLMENYAADWHSLTVQIANQPVATDIGKLALGQWQRYGAYAVPVTEGRLHLSIAIANPELDAHLMGMSIFAE
jgi:hypothetical protein